MKFLIGAIVKTVEAIDEDKAIDEVKKGHANDMNVPPLAMSSAHQ